MKTLTKKEETIDGLLAIASKLTKDWLRANPDCEEEEPWFFYKANGLVEQSHDLDLAAGQSLSKDGRCQILLVSPDSTQALARFSLTSSKGEWLATTDC